MTAFIEYDISTSYRPAFRGGPESPLPSPFSEASGEPYSVTGRGGINTGSKDYTFFGAIAGVRNETGIPPLIPPRGLPPNLSPEVRGELEPGPHPKLGDHNDSWLTTSEINAALAHQRVERHLLSFEAQTILAIMENLASRLGDDRVRLVFGFWS